MRIVLFGKSGQVGWELQRALAPLGHVIALDRHGCHLPDGTFLCGDLTHIEGMRATIRATRPDVIVNAAAYTAVDKAESEQELAQLINGLAPQLMAEEMLKLGGWLVHYSTDYVFNGEGDTPWRETDATSPVNYYGHSKLQGEKAIQQTGCKHLIFRTSWVYGTHGNNFAKTILRLAKERDSLNIINDQFGAPTGAELLADVTAHALRSALSNPALAGLYHLAAAGTTSWHDYASFVIAQARTNNTALRVETVHPIPTLAFPTPAKRPHNSRLDTSKLCHNFTLQMPCWQTGVQRMLKEIQGDNP